MAHASAEVPPHVRPLVDDVCASSPRERTDGEPGVETPASLAELARGAVLGSVRGQCNATAAPGPDQGQTPICYKSIQNNIPAGAGIPHTRVNSSRRTLQCPQPTTLPPQTETRGALTSSVAPTVHCLHCVPCRVCCVSTPGPLRALHPDAHFRVLCSLISGSVPPLARVACGRHIRAVR